MKTKALKSNSQTTLSYAWALGLSLLYVIGWCVCAYLPKGTAGPLGFPLWFELSCIYLPILFIVLAYWILRIVYQDISLEIPTQTDESEDKQ